jgi:hypothetical protein
MQNMRPALALLAAYAVALQSLLFGVVGPLAGLEQISAASICSHSAAGGTDPAAPGHAHPAAPGHGHDCLAACLAGCCAAPAVPVAGFGVVHAPVATRTAALAPQRTPPARAGATGAHRSRAPPLA